MDIRRCLCTPDTRVFMSGGIVYCVRCLFERPLLPLDLQRPSFGVIGMYCSSLLPPGSSVGVVYSSPQCSPVGQCWLSAIFPIARMTSGNFNFQTRLCRVAAIVYRAGRLTPQVLQDLQVYERGCSWYKIEGPVPGVAVYANAMHVSDGPFPGATHVLTNLPLNSGKCRDGFCPFSEARSAIYELAGKTVFINGNTYMWTHGSAVKAIKPWGEIRRLCIRIVRSLPPDHALEIDLSDESGFSFTHGYRLGHIPMKERDGPDYGRCWLQLFKDYMTASREQDLACKLGYVLPTGVAGGYLMRRLQVNGLKLVKKDHDNEFTLWALGHADSYIRHIAPAGEAVEPFFVKVAEFSVVDNTEVTHYPPYRLGRIMRYGYSPPGDGSCGMHCISAVISHMKGGKLKTTSGVVHRDSTEWLDNFDLSGIILALNLPVTLGNCPSASYKIQNTGGHWVVNALPHTAYHGMHLDCVLGTCEGNCKPVPTVPVLTGIDHAFKVRTDDLPYAVAPNAELKDWTYSRALLANDLLSTAIAKLGKQYCDSLKMPEAIRVDMLNSVVGDQTSRLGVHATLESLTQNSATGRVSPKSSSECDLSALGLIHSGSKSTEDLVAKCQTMCQESLAAPEGSDQTNVTRLMEKLLEPTEMSSSKEETHAIISAAITALGNCTPLGGSTVSLQSHESASSWETIDTMSSSDSDVVPTLVVESSVRATQTGCSVVEAESQSDAPTQAKPTAPPRPKRQAAKAKLQAASDNGVTVGSLMWGTSNINLQVLEVVEASKDCFGKLTTNPIERSQIKKLIETTLLKVSGENPASAYRNLVEAANKLPTMFATGLGRFYHNKNPDQVRHHVMSNRPPFIRKESCQSPIRGPSTNPVVSDLVGSAQSPPRSSTSLSSNLGSSKTIFDRSEVEQTAQPANPVPPPLTSEGDIPKIDIKPDLEPTCMTNGDNETSLPPLKTRERLKTRLKPIMDFFDQRVFSLHSHLLTVLNLVVKPQGKPSGLECLYLCWCLLCLLFGFHYPAFVFVPLLGMVTGSPWVRRASLFSVWLGCAVILFGQQPTEMGSSCSTASSECSAALAYYTATERYKPVQPVSVGAFGSVFTFFAVVLGGSRVLWVYLLRFMVLVDLGSIVAYVFFRQRCRHCFQNCIRVAPPEVNLKSLPVTRVAKRALVDLCDQYSAPYTDVIHLATGIPGCWRGKVNPHQECPKPISYSSFDERKVTRQTVVPQPQDPLQAIKAIKVLASNGSLQDIEPPTVRAVTEVPFAAPFFPKVAINPECYVVVDPPTFTCAMRCGYSTKQLVIGTGDFAALNKVPRISGGYRYADFAIVAAYVVLNFLIGAFLSSPSSCGVGTTDPWCSSPFSKPIFGAGTMCNEHLCASAEGLSLPYLSALNPQRWLLAIALVLTALMVALKFVFWQDLLVVGLTLVGYVEPRASVLFMAFPLILVALSVNPLVFVWTHFFVATINPMAACCSIVLSVLAWVLGRLTGAAGLITPYDIHMLPASAQKSLVSAPDGSYLAAVRRSALTGRNIFFHQSNFGSVLEGALRSSASPANVVTVVGSCVGAGAVFTINGKKTVVTATHLLNGSQARVSNHDQSVCVTFTIKNDFACAEVPDWKGDAPIASFSDKRGRCFWLTGSGVEPGVVSDNSALCFTQCGDSGSAVVDCDNNLVGVHTGSNKKGCGVITTYAGKPIGLSDVKLSELSAFFSGPLVRVSKLPQHIIPDVSEIPSDLETALRHNITPEGALSSVQLLCVFVLLWRFIHVPFVPCLAIGFFLLNEILPAVLVRLVFSFCLGLGSLFTPFSAHILLVRLLTAALNRSLKSLLLFISLAAISGLSEIALRQDLAYATWLAVPRILAVGHFSAVVGVLAGVHVTALLLSLFKMSWLTDCLSGNGTFEKTFFIKYFTEGNIRDGVSQSTKPIEGLTAGLVSALTAEDLEFVTRFSDAKCFVSASNMRNGVNEFIECAYAKALRMEVSKVTQCKTTASCLAKLDAFMTGTNYDLTPGDCVVVIGRVPRGEIIEITYKDRPVVLQVVETRVMAGAPYSVCSVVTPETSLENFYTRGSKKKERAERRGIKSSKKVVEKVNINGVDYVKVWHQETGDVTYYSQEDYDDWGKDDRTGGAHSGAYEGMLITEDHRLKSIGLSPAGHFQKFIRKHGKKIGTSKKTMPISKRKKVEVDLETYELDGVEYDVPVNEPLEWTVTVYTDDDCQTGFEAERLSVDQALKHLGHDTTLNEKEKARLRAIIEKLNGLCQEKALNLLAVSELSRCSRGGLNVSDEAVKIVRYHRRTFAMGPINLKVMDFTEWEKSRRHKNHCLVANLTNGVVVMRPHVPSLIDVLISGEDAGYFNAVHGPGNTGIDGSVWDFESPAHPFELELTQQIIVACSVRRGDAPKLDLPYDLHPVRGDPYREHGVLKNSRFGDIPYKTPEDTKSPIHAAACYHPMGVPVTDQKTVIGTTLPHGFELYVPTVPYTVMDYLDSRPDVPKMLTQHGTEAAAQADLSKFNLSTQGFVLPGVLDIVYRYLHRHVGRCPRLFKASQFPAKDSMAGINGGRFTTKMVQSIPDIDDLTDQAKREVWQTVTPVTLKKQYCSKCKTRTILGTNNFMALGIRAALSGVTSGFMKKGKNSPIYLGKNKFHKLPNKVTGLCLEADLASCDRSTPAIVRWFATNILFDLAQEESWKKAYVVNCCHDVLSSSSGCVTKRGGLSSGDPVTSISNTIYSLIIYVQHMVLSFFEHGHPHGGKFLAGELTMEDCLQIQPVMIYSDDVVLYNEPSELPNYHNFVQHLDLLLGFKTDRSKTEITMTPSFLGCLIIAGEQLVPKRDRILAALGYYMKANNASEYYAAAAAILMDCCAAIEYDEEWYSELIVDMALCAKKDGFVFPGPSFFQYMWDKLKIEEGKKNGCAFCAAPVTNIAHCGLELCGYHVYSHSHCPVTLSCGHHLGSNNCASCSNQPMKCNSPLDDILACVPYEPPVARQMIVADGVTTSEPGRYLYRGKILSVRRDKVGNVVDLADGQYMVYLINATCKGINMVKVEQHILGSKFIVGPPGCGKTTFLISVAKDDDVIYTPTYKTMADLVNSFPSCRFTVPKNCNIPMPAPGVTGPTIKLIAAGYQPARTSYIDEAGFCNPLDLLKILSCTPVVCLGDLNQLPPVGFERGLYALDLMPSTQICEVYRYGPAILQHINHLYGSKLISKGPDTGITIMKSFQPYGCVITPFHRDRDEGIITIDSSQGLTFDVVTIYLPSPKSLTHARALVALTRARYHVFIYDPHKQMNKFFNLENHPGCTAVFHSGSKVLHVKDGIVAEGCPPGAITTHPELKKMACLEGTASPLPQVAYNLGFYYSPDLIQFARIPESLCVHWPVVTGRNILAWPDRLVCSMRPLNSFSKPMGCAGYYVGPNIFLGIPGVISYYLTLFRNGEPQTLPDTLVSTGRTALNVREYLDDLEREFAKQNPHAFIGETKGTTVGGAHHITSKFLPPVLVPDSIIKAGVCDPGKAAKSLCTITDIYLPDFEPYLHPTTQSKDWKVLVDFKPTRLMVWRDGTCYFHEGVSPLESLCGFVTITKSEHVYFDIPVFRTNATAGRLPCRVSVSGSKFLTPVVLSRTPPSEAPEGYKLIIARKVRVGGLDNLSVDTFLYSKSDSSSREENIARAARDLKYATNLKGTGFMFPYGEPCQFD
nr:polyprotein 1ab [Arteriviridae sp.]